MKIAIEIVTHLIIRIIPTVIDFLIIKKQKKCAETKAAEEQKKAAPTS